MKSKYVKPQLRMEYFSLSQSIATSCGWSLGSSLGTPTHDSPSNCAWSMPSGENIWMSSEYLCDDAYPVDFPVGDACYNAPSGIAQVFAS